MKFRLFPTDEEKKIFKEMSLQWHWYYNFAVEVLNNPDHDIHPYHIRDEMRRYSYVPKERFMSTGTRIIIDEPECVKGQDEYYKPVYWPTVHNRVIRGAFHSLQSNYKSAMSNLKAGNISRFEMKFKTKRYIQAISFEDFAFPAALKNIKSRFGYRTKDHTRVSVSLKDIVKEAGKRGCTFIYETHTDRYFLHYPVPLDYYPKNDRRSESQTRSGKGIISLDPGVRKFLFGYSPDGSSVMIGNGACKTLTSLLLEIDDEEDSKTRQLLWTKIKNLTDDLHWKSIKFLTNNYDIVVVGDINTKSIIEGKRLKRITKRILNQYSFGKFKERLRWKCEINKKTFILTDECYTSKICCGCGEINDVGSSEVYKCKTCKLVVDRDFNGAKNILNKTITLLPG